MNIELVILAEREACAKIAETLARGVAIEVKGETIPLGIMQRNPGEAQYATANAIATAIRARTASHTSPVHGPK